MENSQIILFIVTSLLLIATPGPDMILVMSRSISFGTKAGLFTALGVSVGLLGHTILATLGLGAILNSSQFLFNLLKILGAFYLIYIAYKTFTAKTIDIQIKDENLLSSKQLFIQGAISNISNPKIAIFYFSFLPQFIPSNTQEYTYLLFTLGLSFAILTFFIKGPIAIFAGYFSNFLRTNTKVQTIMNKISATVLFALGVKLAFESKN